MRTFSLCLMFLIFVTPLSAEDVPCDRLNTVQDLLTCAQRYHPDIIRAEAEMSGLDAFLRSAGQRPNPELDAQSSVADTDAGDVTTTEASLKHIFEMGGKRSSRLSEAKARQTLIRAEAQRRKDEATLQTVLNLFRLRHNLAQRHAVAEALNTFEKIVRQYRSRPKLPPEQEVSLNVFSLAKADYRARLAGLNEERRRLRTFFDLSTGQTLEAVEGAVSSWEPGWPDSRNLESGKGAAWASAEAKQALAEAGVKVAKGEAYPNLAFGPYVEAESGGSESQTGLGGALSLSLPLYQRNGGNVALARREKHTAEIDATQSRRELEALRSALLDIYQMARAALQTAPKQDDMEKTHRSTERLFERGLVSASLIIEAHRQSTDVIAATNEQELAAAEALWTLHALDGRISKESL